MDWLSKLQPEILIFGFGGWVLVSLSLVAALVIIVKKVLNLTTNHMTDVARALTKLSDNVDKNTDFTKEAVDLIRELKNKSQHTGLGREDS